MKTYAWLSLIFFLLSIPAQAVMYEWKDERGVINFTDNPEKIPAKYKKRVRKRASMDNGATESGPATARDSRQLTPAAPEPPPREKEALYGGHSEKWWRSAFVGIREEMNSIQDKLPEKRQGLEAARRKMAIHQFPQYRQAYYSLKSEIEKDEARIEELSKQLEAMDNEAARSAVPVDWRK